MEERKNIKIPRRRFFSWIIPLGSSLIGLSLFRGLYNNSFDRIFSKDLYKTKRATKRNRHISNRTLEKSDVEKLVLNQKSSVVHLRNKKLFPYYDFIKNEVVIDLNSWAASIKRNSHFRKGKSGVIFERLSLLNLKPEISDQKLLESFQILSTSFSKEYYLQNLQNWRVYELLLKYLALNQTTQKNAWGNFSEVIKNVDVERLNIPKKDRWIRSKEEFEKRIQFAINNRGSLIRNIERRILSM